MIGKFVVVLAVAVFISCFTANMNAQQPETPPAQTVSQPSPETKDSGADQIQYTPPPFDPSIFVDVNPNLQLDANTSAIYQQMATTLNGSPFVPQDRLNYFSFYANSNNYTITCWWASVEDVQANCNGYLVTIQVQPGISSTTVGASVLLDGPNYFEQYQIGHGQFVYQAFVDPDGTAGQQFGEIGL